MATPTKPHEIPHTLPTREEIAELADRDITVALAIEQFRAGRVNYEDALRMAVVNLAALLDQATEALQCGEADASIVYLSDRNRDEPPPATAVTTRPIDWAFVAWLVAAAAFGVVACGASVWIFT